MFSEKELEFLVNKLERLAIGDLCPEDRVDAAELACKIRLELHTVRVGKRYADADYKS